MRRDVFHLDLTIPERVRPMGMLLQRLKDYEIARCNVEELVEMDMYAESLITQFEKRKVDVPTWLIARQRDLRSAIKVANAEALQARLAEVRRDRERLEHKAMTPAERLEQKRREEQELEALLQG